MAHRHQLLIHSRRGLMNRDEDLASQAVATTTSPAPCICATQRVTAGATLGDPHSGLPVPTIQRLDPSGGHAPHHCGPYFAAVFIANVAT